MPGRCLGFLLSATAPSDDEIRKRLEEIFSRSEFSPAEPNDWYYRLLNALAGFLKSLSGLYDTAPVLYWLLLIGCIVSLVLLLWHIGWTVRRVFYSTGRLGTRDDLQEQRDRYSLTYWEESLRRAAALEFTEAIRFMFLSLVYRFDESGRINFRQAYTNREYLALFADRPSTHEKLKVFVDTLDDYWYAQRPTDRSRYENCLTLYDGLTTT